MEVFEPTDVFRVTWSITPHVTWYARDSCDVRFIAE